MALNRIFSWIIINFIQFSFYYVTYCYIILGYIIYNWFWFDCGVGLIVGWKCVLFIYSVLISYNREWARCGVGRYWLCYWYSGESGIYGESIYIGVVVGVGSSAVEYIYNYGYSWIIGYYSYLWRVVGYLI